MQLPSVAQGDTGTRIAVKDMLQTTACIASHFGSRWSVGSGLAALSEAALRLNSAQATRGCCGSRPGAFRKVSEWCMPLFVACLDISEAFDAVHLRMADTALIQHGALACPLAATLRD